MSCACIEHLDFTYNLDLSELDIQPFKQIQHNFVGYTSLTEGPKLVAKEEEKRNFAVILETSFVSVNYDLLRDAAWLSLFTILKAR